MSLALFAMINELKAEVVALTARVTALEVRGMIFHEPKPNATRDALLDGVAPREPKVEPRVAMNLPTTVMGVSEPRPTLTLSKPNKRA